MSLQWQVLNDKEALADAVPPYPYGPTRWYKQSSLGLYGGQRIRFGNNVSPDTETKSRRSWAPNVKVKKLHSKALNRYVQVRVTTRVLRTIDKLGGLDEYLLGEKDGRIKELGESGWWLRWAIMQTAGVKKRFAEERARLGLPEEAELTPEITADLEAEAAVDEDVEIAFPTDDAFVVEDSPDSPPLRWRVGPHQHLVLSSAGWQRVREDPKRRKDIRMAPVRAKLEQNVVRTLEIVEAEMKAKNMDLATSKQALKAARRSLRAEVDAEVESIFEKWEATKTEEREARQVLAKERKKAKKALDEE